ncbi:MAG: hypothetical protein HUK22_05960 [Thermoguttaceae bacterium]|nr:hypothetical protein [Thermoguttaceae bacterium]
MFSFLDGANRRWEVSITLRNVKRVFDDLGVDLFAPWTPDEKGRYLASRLMDEDLLFGEVLVSLVRDQIAPNEMTLDDLRDRITPEVLNAASKPFFDEYALFFQRRGKAKQAIAIAQVYAVVEKQNVDADSTILGVESSASPQGRESTTQAD